jgi:hypothetical protein
MIVFLLSFKHWILSVAFSKISLIYVKRDSSAMLQDEATYKETNRLDNGNSRFRNFGNVPIELIKEPVRKYEIMWKEWMKELIKLRKKH